MAVDRFQTICYPMVNRVWKPEISRKKIAVAWATALLACIPQLFVFTSVMETAGPHRCVAQLDQYGRKSIYRGTGNTIDQQ